MNIKSWLADKNRSYLDGINIINKYKPALNQNRFFDKSVNPKPDSMEFRMMLKYIKNIYRVLAQNNELTDEVKEEIKGKAPISVENIKHNIPNINIKTINHKKQEQSRPRIADHPIINIDELPAELQKVYFDNKKVVAEMSTLKEKIKHKMENSKRLEFVQRLDDLDKQNFENWQKIDNWYLDKPKKEVKTENQSDVEIALKKEKKRKNIIQYIARAEKELETTRDNLKPKKLERINKWKEELKKLEV